MNRGKDARFFVAGALTVACAALVGCKGQVQLGDEPGSESEVNASSDATSSNSGSSGSRSEPSANSVGDDGGPEEAGPGSTGGGTTAGDASSGCSALSVCCETLSGSTQALCNSVAGGGDATHCATEMSQLQSEDYCAGFTILATQVQESPSRMVSDGTLLYWATFESAPGVFAVPVGGGAVMTLLSASVGNSQGGQFLAVDAENLYVLETFSLVRIPKDASPATLVNEAGASVLAATSLGGTAYWLERVGDFAPSQPFAVKSSPLQGGPVTTVATFTPNALTLSGIAVTSSAVFVNMLEDEIFYFPIAGLPDGGPIQIGPTGYGSCGVMSSDTAAVYCPMTTGSDLLFTSGGTTAPLGATDNSSFIVSDETNVYWVDEATVGYIKKAPKGGGGPVTILAQDTSPTAIAVDAHSVYWADAEGYIKSMPK